MHCAALALNLSVHTYSAAPTPTSIYDANSRVQLQGLPRAAKRCLAGMKEVAWAVGKAGRTRLVLLAPNIQIPSADSVLLAQVLDLVHKCNNNGVPVIMGPSRKHLGMAFRTSGVYRSRRDGFGAGTVARCCYFAVLATMLERLPGIVLKSASQGGQAPAHGMRLPRLQLHASPKAPTFLGPCALRRWEATTYNGTSKFRCT